MAMDAAIRRELDKCLFKMFYSERDKREAYLVKDKPRVKRANKKFAKAFDMASLILEQAKDDIDTIS